VSQYHGLSTIPDPATQKVVKLLMDRLSSLEAQAASIGTVSQPLSSHLNANKQQIKALADPSAPADAVTLSYLQHYVESRVQGVVGVAAPATASTAAGGAPAGTSPPGPISNIPGGTGPAGTGSLTRGFDLATATIYNSPPDIASWPVTGTISMVSVAGVSGQNGVYCTCSKVSAPFTSPPPSPGQWPQDPVAYPDAVNLQYTLWAVVQISGTWYASGFVQMWIGRPGTGSTPIGADWLNWAYSSRWGPMNGYVPLRGSQMGFFLSAGNARGFTGVSTVRERSDVVLLSLPDTPGAVYT
jgi:hypothetical protein